MKDLESMSSVADQIELIDILEEARKKKDTKTLKRITKLTHNLIFRINKLEMTIMEKDIVYSHRIEEKNREILRLRHGR